MKKAQKLIALVLALTLMFALAAMTASAATARGVTCDSCGSSKTNTYVKTVNVGQETVATCSKVQGYHLHSRHRDQTMLRCNSCKDEFVMGTGSEYTVCRG